MAYELHIARPDGRIALEEWLEVVNTDPELESVGAAESGPVGIEGDGLATWTGHPKNCRVWFDYRRGQVHVNARDDRVIMKAVALAGRLNAVVGDEGEEYGSDGSLTY